MNDQRSENMNSFGLESVNAGRSSADSSNQGGGTSFFAQLTEEKETLDNKEKIRRKIFPELPNGFEWIELGSLSNFEKVVEKWTALLDQGYDLVLVKDGTPIPIASVMYTDEGPEAPIPYQTLVVKGEEESKKLYDSLLDIDDCCFAFLKVSDTLPKALVVHSVSGQGSIPTDEYFKDGVTDDKILQSKICFLAKSKEHVRANVNFKDLDDRRQFAYAAEYFGDLGKSYEDVKKFLAFTPFEWEAPASNQWKRMQSYLGNYARKVPLDDFVKYCPVESWGIDLEDAAPKRVELKDISPVFEDKKESAKPFVRVNGKRILREDAPDDVIANFEAGKRILTKWYQREE